MSNKRFILSKVNSTRKFLGIAWKGLQAGVKRFEKRGFASLWLRNLPEGLVISGEFYGIYIMYCMLQCLKKASKEDP